MDDKEKLINRILEDIQEYNELFELEERVGIDWGYRLDRLADKLRDVQFEELLEIFRRD